MGIITFSFIILTSGLHALTVTKTYSGASPITVDGTPDYGVQLDPVTFSNADFFAGAVISKVTVLIDWTKTDATCADTTTTGNAYHAETNFRLDGPSNNVILATPGSHYNNTDATWTGGDTIDDVITVFDQILGVPIPAGKPVSGTYRPNGGNLNDFVGLSPVGDWQLSAGDIANNDPLCVYSYSVSITTDTDTDGDGVFDLADVDDDNDGILDTIELSCTGTADSFTANGIANPGNALGARDDNRATMGIGDSFVLDLTNTVDAGEDIFITLARNNNAGNYTIQASADGSSFTDIGTYSSGIVDVAGTVTYTAPVGGARYIRFIRNGGGLHIYSIEYSCILDADGDGIANQLDLDSDNDSIPDNVEGQPTDTYIAPSGGGTSMTDVNNNGLDDNYESAQGGTDHTLPDTDSDGIPDYLDTDSDSDRVSDCIEGQPDPTQIGAKVCPVVNTNVGNNGLIDWAENTDDYNEVSGIISDPATDLIDYKTATAEVSYREFSPCGNIVWELKTNQWKTISAPCKIMDGGSDAEVSAIFSSLGTQCITDNVSETCNWTMYRQSDFTGSSVSDAVRVTPTNTMFTTTGYWIISDHDANVTVESSLQEAEEINTPALNHSVVRTTFANVNNLGTLPAHATNTNKIMLGYPFSGELKARDLFVNGGVASPTTFYPMDDDANISSYMYQTVYIYDAVGKDTSNYVAIPTTGTPGFNDVIEAGIGFWIGQKGGTGSIISVDYPYYNR